MMAPSSFKGVIISLLAIFSMVAPNLPPSTATRSAQVAAPAPAPPRGASAQLKWFLTPDFPCFPFLPQPLLDLCHILFPPPTPSPPAPPYPTECRSFLKKKLVPSCAGFLTDPGVSAPSSDCCSGINSFFDDDSTTPFCLCHVANGDIAQLLPAPAPAVNQTRGVDVIVACDTGLTEGQVNGYCDKDNDTFRKMVPPMDPPSSPPPANGKKA